MAKKSKTDNTIDFAKLIIGLIFVLAFFIANGDISKTVETMASMASLFVLVGFICVFIYVIYKIYSSRAQFLNKSITANFEELDQNNKLEKYELTKQSLFKLEWRRFEILIESLLCAEGVMAYRTSPGPDDGIDLVIRMEKSSHSPVIAIVQCKAWKTSLVGVKAVRELYGVMVAKSAQRAYLFAIDGFTDAAEEFVNGKPVELIDGEGIIEKFNNLRRDQRGSIIKEVFSGDFSTPTCPSCDIKMVPRRSRYGESWGCVSFPKCKNTIRISKNVSGGSFF